VNTYTEFQEKLKDFFLALLVISLFYWLAASFYSLIRYVLLDSCCSGGMVDNLRHYISTLIVLLPFYLGVVYFYSKPYVDVEKSQRPIFFRFANYAILFYVLFLFIYTLNEIIYLLLSGSPLSSFVAPLIKILFDLVVAGFYFNQQVARRSCPCFSFSVFAWILSLLILGVIAFTFYITHKQIQISKAQGPAIIKTKTITKNINTQDQAITETITKTKTKRISR
jgi:quinol-cytochrome oxidoreductase complex cytochrome b subunit